MLRRIRIATLFLAFFALPGALFARPIDTAALDALVSAKGDADGPGISVAVSHGGEVIYEGWSGLADIERQVPITDKTRFPVASISKQFTAYAILMLVDEGEISLDQPVADFFPAMNRKLGDVTIGHLLAHTGGLREVNSLLQMVGRGEATPTTGAESLAMILRQEGRNFAPGTAYEYSNTGYQLLAHIVARSKGVDFSEYLRSEVFAPLGMEQSAVRDDPVQMLDNIALGYARNGEAFTHQLLVSANYGSTGMVSTPRNLLRWGHALNTRQGLNASVIQRMARRSTLSDGTPAVAANGQEFRDWRGLGTWSHGGSEGGFRSFLLRIPEEGIVIAVMGNNSDFLKAAFAFDLAEALLADRLEPAVEPDMTPETIAELDSYEGDYRLFPGTILSVRREGDQLYFGGTAKEGGTPLQRLSKGSFMFIPGRDIRFEFRDFKNGKATQLRWQVSEDGFIPALRVKLEPRPEPLSDPSEHIGTYYSDELQIGFDVLEVDGVLHIQTSLTGPVPLDRYQPDTFRPLGPVPFARLKFERPGEDGQTRFVVSNPLAEGIVFRKIG